MPKKLILRNFCYLNPGDLKLPILKLLPGLATIVKLSKRQDLVLLKENNVHVHISPNISAEGATSIASHLDGITCWKEENPLLEQCKAVIWKG